MRAAIVTIAVLAAVSVAGGGANGQVIVIPVKLCTQGEAESAVGRFVTAFNAGRSRQLDVAFARRPDFRWYATDGPGERLLPAAADRGSLVAYFARRHARDERLTLRSFRFNGNTIASGNLKSYGNFQYRLIRQADDLEPTRYGGKGALHCYHGLPDRLIVWSMGRES
jgi:hypothetical protein